MLEGEVPGGKIQDLYKMEEYILTKTLIHISIYGSHISSHEEKFLGVIFFDSVLGVGLRRLNKGNDSNIG